MNTLSPHAPNGKARIYGLVDPLTFQVFYVGRTTRPLHIRLAQHIKEARQNKSRKKAQLICSLLREGLTPSIVELEQVPLVDSVEAEGKWMRYYASLGITLLNVRDHHCGSFPYDSPLPSAPHRRIFPKEVIDQLGKMPDAKLGEIYGFPEWVVTRARHRRSIPSFDAQHGYPSRIKQGDARATADRHRIHLPQEAVDQFGKVSDMQLGKMYGVSSGLIRNERTKRGIAPFDEARSRQEGCKKDQWNTKHFPQEAIDQLGKVYDCELARRYGVSNSLIALERHRRGIPSFDEQQGYTSRIQQGHKNELRWNTGKRGGDANEESNDRRTGSSN